MYTQANLFIAVTFLLVLITPYWGFSQEAVTLEKLLSLLPNQEGKERIRTLNEIAFRYIDNNENFDEVIKLGQEAYELAHSIAYDIGQAYALTCISLGHEYKRNYPQAIEYQLQSLEIRKGIGGLELVSGYHNLADLYRIVGDAEKALGMENSSLKICQEVLTADSTNERAKNYLVMIYRTLGDIQKLRKQYSLAVQAYHKALEVGEQLEEKYSLAHIYVLLGIAYKDQGLYEKAATYYEEALAAYKLEEKHLGIAVAHNNLGELYFLTGQYVRAIATYDKSLAYYEAQKDTLAMGEVLNNLGGVYKAMRDYPKASQYFAQALTHHRSANHPKGEAEALFNIGSLALAKSKAQEAIVHLEESRMIAHKIDDKHLMLKVTSALTKAYEMKEAYPEALASSETRAAIAESLQSDKALTLSLLFNLEAERMTNDHRSEMTLKDKKLSQTIIISLSVVTGLLLLIIFAIMRISTDRQRIQLERERALEAKNRVQEERQRTMEANHKVDQVLSEQAVHILANRLEAQEEERKRVAKDLHDRVSVMLSGVQLFFKAIDDKVSTLQEETVTQFTQATELLGDAAKEVRLISHNMVSGVLHEYGLSRALQDLVNTINRTNQIEVKLYDFKMEQRIDAKVETNVFRIIQELVNNVLKHAEATKIDIGVNFFKEENLLNVVVEDNGKGFDPDKVEKKVGIGLGNIKERMNFMNGELTVDSELGRGTIFIMDIPLPQKLEKNL